MNCPHCGSNNTSVTETRPSTHNTRTRRRKCKACGEWFGTLELALPYKAAGTYYNGPTSTQHYKIRPHLISRISSFVANSLAA